MSPDTQEAETGGWHVEDLPEFWSEFRASLGNLIRPWVKIQSETRAEKVAAAQLTQCAQARDAISRTGRVGDRKYAIHKSSGRIWGLG